MTANAFYGPISGVHFGQGDVHIGGRPPGPVEVDWTPPDGFEDVAQMMSDAAQADAGLPFAMLTAALESAEGVGDITDQHAARILNHLRARLAEVVTRGVANG